MSDFDHGEQEGPNPPPDKKSMYPDATPEVQEKFINYIGSVPDNERLVAGRLLIIGRYASSVGRKYYTESSPRDKKPFSNEANLRIISDGYVELDWQNEEGGFDGLVGLASDVDIFSGDSSRTLTVEYDADENISSLGFLVSKEPHEEQDDDISLWMDREKIENVLNAGEVNLSVEEGVVYKIRFEDNAIFFDRYHNDMHLDYAKIPIKGKDIVEIKEKLFDQYTLDHPDTAPSALDDSWRNANPFSLFGIEWVKVNHDPEWEVENVSGESEV